MLNLVLGHGAEFVSNNRTVIRNGIENPEIVGGTTSISIRKEDVDRYRKFISADAVREMSVTGFQLFTPDELSVRYVQLGERSPKLDLVIFIELKEGADCVSHLNWESAVYRAYENISKTQWGECLLFNGKIPAPILEGPGGPGMRLTYLRNLLENTTSVSIK